MSEPLSFYAYLSLFFISLLLFPWPLNFRSAFSSSFSRFSLFPSLSFSYFRLSLLPFTFFLSFTFVHCVILSFISLPVCFPLSYYPLQLFIILFSVHFTVSLISSFLSLASFIQNIFIFHSCHSIIFPFSFLPQRSIPPFFRSFSSSLSSAVFVHFTAFPFSSSFLPFLPYSKFFSPFVRLAVWLHLFPYIFVILGVGALSFTSHLPESLLCPREPQDPPQWADNQQNLRFSLIIFCFNVAPTWQPRYSLPRQCSSAPSPA